MDSWSNYSAPLWAWVIVLLLYYSKNCIEFRISVLHSSFSDGVQLGKIIGTAVSTEATADLLLYLDFPNSPFTGNYSVPLWAWVVTLEISMYLRDRCTIWCFILLMIEGRHGVWWISKSAFYFYWCICLMYIFLSYWFLLVFLSSPQQETCNRQWSWCKCSK